MPKSKNPAPQVRTCAPKPAGDGPEIRGDLPLGVLKPSPTNPRKTFPADGLQQLAASFHEHGILAPLLVRPMGPKARWDGKAWHDVDHFEVVAGERRLRAAKLAGVDLVPVVVRFLSDAEALEIQLIENDQREDVTPSEQAAAYARLVAAGKTIDDVAAVTGKGVPFVRSVLSLAKLPDWALDAVDAGTLPRRTAEVLSRIPGEATRAKAAACVLKGQRWCDDRPVKPPGKKDAVGEPLTYTETRHLIAHHFQVELKGATFSRKSLDLVEAAGSCDDCPKRAGNDPDATAEGVRADMCLDPACFEAKTDANNSRVLAAAKETGKKILPAKEADKVFQNGGWMSHASPYVALDETCYQDSKGRKYKTLLKDLKADQIVVAIDTKGDVRELVKKDVAAKALKDVGVKSRPSSSADPGEAARRKKAEAGNAAAARACEIVAQRIEANSAGNFIPSVSYMRPLVLALIDAMWADASRLVARRRKLGKGVPRDLIAAEAVKLTTSAELLALTCELIAARKAHGWGSPWSNGRMDKDEEALWKAFGVDRAQLVKEAQAEQKKPKFQPDYDAIERDAARGKKPGKPSKNGTHPPVTKPVGSLSLADVPKFPTEACVTLAQSDVVTLADLEPHVEAKKQKGAMSPIFDALRDLGLRNSPHLFAAGDALVEHLMPAAPPSPKPTRKEKVKS